MPIPFLQPFDDVTPFPPVEKALDEPNGLLMAGGALTPRRLAEAYRSGIFPWFEEGEPVLWWSPDPRCVIWPENIRIRRSLAKTLRKGHLRIAHNTAYGDVMRACAEPRQNSSGTWITPSMLEAYQALHAMGMAHSIEVFLEDRLVGGLYGVEVGSVFIGESMFSRVSDASKVALVHLAQCGRYKLIDCQLATPHLESMGAEEISRSEYITYLQKLGKSKPKTSMPSGDNRGGGIRLI